MVTHAGCIFASRPYILVSLAHTHALRRKHGILLLILGSACTFSMSDIQHIVCQSVHTATRSTAELPRIKLLRILSHCAIKRLLRTPLPYLPHLAITGEDWANYNERITEWQLLATAGGKQRPEKPCTAVCARHLAGPQRPEGYLSRGEYLRAAFVVRVTLRCTVPATLRPRRVTGLVPLIIW
jgi:hypothetical protein